VAAKRAFLEVFAWYPSSIFRNILTSRSSDKALSLRLDFLTIESAALMAEAPKWYDAYPKPRTTKPESVSAKELLELFRAGSISGSDILLIDLRRVDHEVSDKIA
jgi:hypothetical protein